MAAERSLSMAEALLAASTPRASVDNVFAKDRRIIRAARAADRRAPHANIGLQPPLVFKFPAREAAVRSRYDYRSERSTWALW
jgi:hypothetical protein